MCACPSEDSCAEGPDGAESCDAEDAIRSGRWWPPEADGPHARVTVDLVVDTTSRNGAVPAGLPPSSAAATIASRFESRSNCALFRLHLVVGRGVGTEVGTAAAKHRSNGPPSPGERTPRCHAPADRQPGVRFLDLSRADCETDVFMGPIGGL